VSCGGGFQISTKITHFVKNHTKLIRTIQNLKSLYSFQTTEFESPDNHIANIGSRSHIEFLIHTKIMQKEDSFYMAK